MAEKIIETTTTVVTTTTGTSEPPATKSLKQMVLEYLSSKGTQEAAAVSVYFPESKETVQIVSDDNPALKREIEIGLPENKRVAIKILQSASAG